jgi:hypothetical protein
LISDGVEEGTIQTGIQLTEGMFNDAVSLAEIMDEIADKNQYQWFIDKDFKLQFYQDANLDAFRELSGSMNATYISENTYCSNNTLCSDQTFSDFRDVKVSNNVSDYSNYIHFVGGNDGNGNLIRSIRRYRNVVNAKQDICAGSGMFGEVIRNNSIVDSTTYSASAGTTTTNLNVTGHPFSLGDYFFNRTQNAYGHVEAIIDADNVTCSEITGQTNADSIDHYTVSNAITKNIYRQKSNKPTTLTFHSYDMTFLPQQKLHVHLPVLNIYDSYFNIESVTITDAGQGYFNQTVTAVLRDITDFSSQRRRNYTIDFFKNF